MVKYNYKIIDYSEMSTVTHWYNIPQLYVTANNKNTKIAVWAVNMLLSSAMTLVLFRYCLDPRSLEVNGFRF